MLLQIVDARNPYFFYSADLEKYIGEVGAGKKQFVLLVNKADFLSDELLEHWNGYFKEKGIEHIFFSALAEQAKIDGQEHDLDSEGETSDADEFAEARAALDVEEIKLVQESIGGFKNELERQAREEREAERRKRKLDRTVDEDLQPSTPQVFSRSQLLTWLKKKARAMQEEEQTTERMVVGTVGYPNVGKSSVINVLMGIKRVSVGALPGKTKHFQTLNLTREVQLCDCPGLVFPSFANSKAEMMCCGVLPIDQMREHIAPIQIVLSRVPKEVLEAFYKIELPPEDSPKYSVSTFLQVFATKKGWKTGTNNPAEVHASKVVMKDYTTGRLLHCQLRPDFNPAIHKPCRQNGFNMEVLAKKQAPDSFTPILEEEEEEKKDERLEEQETLDDEEAKSSVAKV